MKPTTFDSSSPGTVADKVKTFSKSIESQLEPIELFAGLGKILGNENTMLLESSEIDSKVNVKSILMLKAAIRIQACSQQVILKALTPNGLNALNLFKQTTQNLASQTFTVEDSPQAQQLIVSFTKTQQAIDEDSRLKSTSPIDAIRMLQTTFADNAQNEFSTFICGLFSFDFIASFETLPQVEQGKNGAPDYVFYLAETLLVCDHKLNTKRLICNHFNGENETQTYFELARRIELIEASIPNIGKHKTAPTLKAESNFASKCSSSAAEAEVDISNEEFQSIVADLKQKIIAGDIFQVVPSRTFSLHCASSLESYRQLKHSNPSPYLFYMHDQDFVLFGASPESALKYTQQTNKVLLYPIAGTRPRGKQSNGEIDLDLDARIEAEMKLDHKEISEHMMLVDLARNDIARIAKPGTTHVPRLLAVDRYSQVMHLVSCVEGELRSDLDALHAYQACMNMGTLTGAPKIKATQIIREVEGKRRGSYGGAVGYINGQGDMDTCIVIRSALVCQNTAFIQAGAGIVYDSIPALEAQETESKAKAVINAVFKANELVERHLSRL
ncbi:anthranilate synthase component 1 [Aliikangiella sp. IMCC44632]